ncbi:MAG: TonB-dependent receptor [Chromatiales bacterium]|nr:MAG: TonB-dependent receptor [Chromatiales bacterium]
MKTPAGFIGGATAVLLSVTGVGQAAELEDILVTAQKRVQSEQDVPIAISAVSGEALKVNVIRDVFNLRVAIPSLEIRAVDPPGQGTSFAIRGLGTSVFNIGFEPSVGTFVDGIYRSRSGLVASNDIYDMERIEVLKGPQGTLFGKNTTAGVVHFLTNRPDFSGVNGAVEANYEEYDVARINGFFNAPITDTLATRVTWTYANGDGWLDNKADGNETNDRDRYSLRGQVLWQPTESLGFRLIGDYAKVDNEQCCFPMRLINDPQTGPINGPAAASIGSTIIDPADIDDLDIAANGKLSYDAEDKGMAAEIKWDVGAFTITSMTGYRDYDDSNSKDNDFTGVDVLRSNQNLPEVQLLSQELRFEGQLFDDRVDWIVGGYYADEDIERSNEFIWGSQITDFPFFAPGLFGNVPGRAFLAEFEQNTKTYAAFAHGTWRMADQWSLTAGLRYTKDDKDAKSRNDQPQALPLPVVFDFSANTDDSEPTGTISLQYDLEEDVMFYGTYARGFKSGGISLNRDAAGAAVILEPPAGGCPPGFVSSPPVCLGTQQDPTFDKETADHFELGMKSYIADGQVRLNASVFYTEFDDLQLQILRPDGTFDVTNASGARSRGLEVETDWAITDNLTVNASALYLDADFDDDVGLLDPTRPDPSGQQLPFSSEWTGQIGFDYDRPDTLGQWGLFASGNWFGRTNQFVDTLPDDERKEGRYALVNLRSGVRSPNDQWELSVWCRNCFDKRYTMSRFAIPFDGLILGSSTLWSHVGEPRIVGGTVTFNFGE